MFIIFQADILLSRTTQHHTHPPNHCANHHDDHHHGRTPGQEKEFHYREAVRLYPPYISAYVNLGVLLGQSSRTAEAIEVRITRLRVGVVGVWVYVRGGWDGERGSVSLRVPPYLCACVRVCVGGCVYVCVCVCVRARGGCGESVSIYVFRQV